MAYIKTLKTKELVDDLPDCEGYLLAYSGGADSTALLHLFSQVKNVRAIHINHGLQDKAGNWESHCQSTCDKLGVELIVEKACLKDSSENSCRKARYGFFSKHLKPYEVLLTAHHAQDQAETILLKLLRGTGIGGLTGIDKLLKFSHGFIARPLLGFSSQQLKDYLVEKGINWVEDGSNKDNLYRRNYIRNEILPALQSQFPQVVRNINRSSNNVQSSLNLLNYLCDFQGKELPIAKLTALPKSLRTSLFYHWLDQKNIPTPDSKTLKQITHDFVHAASDKNPHYKNEFYQLFRSQKAIYCVANFATINPNKTYQWNTDKPFVFPNNCGSLSYTGSKSLLLVVKFNQKGQKIKLPNRNTKVVKKLFQEYRVHQWNKSNTPFIFLNNKLISLGHNWSHTADINNSISLKNKNLEI